MVKVAREQYLQDDRHLSLSKFAVQNWSRNVTGRTMQKFKVRQLVANRTLKTVSTSEMLYTLFHDSVSVNPIY